MNNLRLGINIDHVATVRNARGGDHPCPIRAALIAQEAGADGITAHLREDRRHIKDHDIKRLKAEVPLPLNMEMAATDEMLAIALEVKPHAVCLVPEKREELTTEGGLDVVKLESSLGDYVKKLQAGGCRVSLFVAAENEQIKAAKRVGADIVELHTGQYCHVLGEEREAEFLRISECAMMAHGLGLEVHAGHGLTYDTVGAIARLPEIMELNIGHFLMGEAMFIGMKEAIVLMKKRITNARNESKA
ncbi:MAG: pyridoxine 5'-phosphate synthase [Rickettsiales bacterium]